MLAALLPAAALAFAVPAAAHEGHEHALDWNNYEKILLTKDTGEPIDLAVLPDSRVLHTARNGDIRLTDPGTGITSVINTIDVYANSEDGLQTIALDPDFEENQWVYLFYAPRAMDAPYPETTPSGNAPTSLPAGQTEAFWEQWKGYNLLARFKWDEETNSLDLSSQQDIIKVEVQRGQCCHVAGDIAFDEDGNLYLATGDNTPASAPGANGFAPNNDAPGVNPGMDARRGAGNSNDLRGAILRINVQEDGSYTIPDGNLFEPGTEGTRPEIYVMGLRNPFRIDYDAQSGALVWGDYGPDAGSPNAQRGPMGFVEWQSTTDPINAGWPYCHGPNANYNEWDFATATPGEWFDCDAGAVNNSRWNTGLSQLPPATAPQLYYGDNDTHQPWPELTNFGAGSGQGPMGGPVYRHDPHNESASAFPEYWDGKAFFGEFSQDYVATFTLDLAANGPVTEIIDFLPNSHLNSVVQPPWDNPMDLEFGPDGSLYVLEYGDGFFRQNPDAGLYRVDYAEGNKSPQAHISADPISSSEAPLPVNFDASRSRDPEGAPLTYDWDFDGNGTYDAAGVTVSHTYTDLGRYDARLRVTDPSGKFGLTTVQISVGNVAPDVTLSTPDGGFFDWGQAVPVTVGVSDPEDGDEPVCSRVNWAFGLGHDEHAHPLSSGTGCTFGVPTPVDAPEHGETENIYGVLVVGYTDEGHNGVPPARGEASLILNPKTQQAEWFDDMQGVEVTEDETARGLRKVTSFGAGDWIAFDPVNFEGIDAMVTRASGRGTLSLRWNDPKAPAFATATFRDGGGWTEVETALSGAPEGSGRLYVTSTSGVEVDEFAFTGDGIADLTPPEVSVTLNPAEPDGANGWYTSNVSVAVNATDNGTVASRQRSTNGGATWSNANNPLTVSAEGITTVHYRATDNGGNVSEVGVVEVKIDKTAPTVTVSGVDDGAEYAASETVELEFAASDATSGIAAVEAELDGEPIEAGELDLWTLAVGAHELVVTATDEAGHTAAETVEFTVTTSFADLAAIVDGYRAAGAIERDSVPVLLHARLDNAAKHADAGRTAQAVSELEKVIRTAGDRRYVVDGDARDVLVHQAEALIGQLSG
ncbi:carbohydrate-binding protein [Phytoactinopolyspora alkaliphila]|uniref:Carbohydrate-binding protein n=1 Tax=Phytoactinopolyspora alkaliphila TaxID=1783498 RepID=A0A6N9YRT0_9ACTN|nr:PQQ-dependent sugar dehydrogenase [Phytoactinopolyspora alkaliphila]NED97766.1 carbohydrate-binding protein [Phytoactinopolyspora alkaliphila]